MALTLPLPVCDLNSFCSFLHSSFYTAYSLIFEISELSITWLEFSLQPVSPTPREPDWAWVS